MPLIYPTAQCRLLGKAVVQSREKVVFRGHSANKGCTEHISLSSVLFLFLLWPIGETFPHLLPWKHNRKEWAFQSEGKSPFRQLWLAQMSQLEGYPSIPASSTGKCKHHEFPITFSHNDNGHQVKYSRWIFSVVTPTTIKSCHGFQHFPTVSKNK